MGHKSRKQKKKFDKCEHIGFGKYCHRCKKEQEDEYDRIFRMATYEE